MTTPELTDLISGIATLVTSLGIFWAVVRGKSQIIEKVNGHHTEVLHLVQKSAHVEGKVEGIIEGAKLPKTEVIQDRRKAPGPS